MTANSVRKKSERQLLMDENHMSNCIGRSLRHNDRKISRLFFPQEKIHQIDLFNFLKVVKRNIMIM